MFRATQFNFTFELVEELGRSISRGEKKEIDEFRVQYAKENE